MNQTRLYDLSLKLGKLLQQRALMLTTAESCTGGYIAQMITAVANSSQWFERGFVTYSNQAKIEMLDVKADTLAREGAVSEAVVAEMAIGALKHSHAQISIAVSGIAGPSGGSAEKPVGTVHFAIASVNKNVQTYKQHFSGKTPTAFQDATRRVRGRAAECTNRDMSSEASTQQSRGLKGEGCRQAIREACVEFALTELHFYLNE